MKKILLFLVFTSLSALGQQTATLTDSDGTVWINGTWSANLISPNGAPSVARVPLTAAQQYAQGTLSAAGALSATLVPTNTLDQSGATWQFRISPNSSVTPSTVSTTITSSNQSLTTVLSAGITAPRFPAGPQGRERREWMTYAFCVNIYANGVNSQPKEREAREGGPPEILASLVE